MNYADFTAFDFAVDDNFLQWVLRPTPATNKYWQEWLAMHPEKQAAVSEAIELVTLMRFAENPVPEELISQTKKAVFTAIAEKKIIPLYPDKKQNPAVIPAGKPTRRAYPWLKIAAAITLLLVAGSLLLSYFTRTSEIYATKFGEIKEIRLPDGSRVVLNGNSTLQYQAWLRFRPREVILTGEAFFSVRHKPNHQPFRVTAAHLTVEVLGTTFNVKNRRRQARVVLTSGQVKIIPQEGRAGEPEAVILQPNEMVFRAGPNAPLQKEKVNPAVYTSWRQHQLIFVATPLREVADVLEDNYGYQIEFRSAATGNWEFTGSASAANLDSFFQDLVKLYNLKIEKHGKKVKISSL